MTNTHTTDTTFTVALTVEVPIGHLSAWFCTALEGGIGYWSLAENYYWLDDETDSPDETGFYSDIIELGDDYDEKTGPKHHIDMGVMLRGFTLFAEKYPHWLWREGGVEDWDGLDATAADVIVQLGLFGEVVYG